MRFSHHRHLIVGIALLLALAIGRGALGVRVGLRGHYFDGRTATSATPTWSAIDRQVSTASVDANWVGDPPARFRVRWFGFLSVPSSGSYTLALESDDGATLDIDGRRVVDNGGIHGPTRVEGTVELSAGPHAVLIEYEQAGGAYSIDWQWGATGTPLAAVPPWALSPNRVPMWRLQAARVLEYGIWLMLGVTLALTVRWTMLEWPRVSAAATAWPRTASLLLFVLLAAAETWPLALHPSRLSRNDNADTVLNEWVISWVSHQALAAPHRLFDANIFYPERLTLAYSESMPVQSAMAAPILWLGGSPVLAYNLVLLAGFTLTGWTMAIVLARWTGQWTAGVTGGAIFAFNAHSLTRLPHLQAQHVEFLPLALLSLDTLLHHPGPRAAMRLAGWFSLQALTSIYLLVFTTVALGVSAMVRPLDWIAAGPARVWRSLASAAAVSALVLAPFLLPYWFVYTDSGLTRTLDDARRFAAGWSAYLATPARLHFETWSQPFFGSVALFPGAVAVALAGVAVVRGIAWRDPRARMGLAVGLVGFYLSFGAYAPGFATLHDVVPLLHAVRDVSRFGMLTIAAVAILAAFGLADLVARSRRRHVAWLAACAPLLVLLDTSPAPVWYSRFDGIPAVYDRLRDAPGAILVEFPFHRPGAEFRHAAYMLGSTRHWQPMLNGYSGFQPLSFHRHVDALYAFPDGPWLHTLRERGVTHMLVHADQYPPSALDRLEGWPGVTRVLEQDGIRVYRLTR
ncbi:MAG: PA14 domain-containing protein [Vicinamibacterales bacterium]